MNARLMLILGGLLLACEEKTVLKEQNLVIVQTVLTMTVMDSLTVMTTVALVLQTARTQIREMPVTRTMVMILTRQIQMMTKQMMTTQMMTTPMIPTTHPLKTQIGPVFGVST